MSSVKSNPDVDDLKNLGQRKISQGEIVRRRERDDITFSRNGFSPQEKGGET